MRIVDWWRLRGAPTMITQPWLRCLGFWGEDPWPKGIQGVEPDRSTAKMRCILVKDSCYLLLQISCRSLFLRQFISSEVTLWWCCFRSQLATYPGCESTVTRPVAFPRASSGFPRWNVADLRNVYEFLGELIGGLGIWRLWRQATKQHWVVVNVPTIWRLCSFKGQPILLRNFQIPKFSDVCVNTVPSGSYFLSCSCWNSTIELSTVWLV